MMEDDDIDIYEDLANFGAKSNKDCPEVDLELKKKIENLENKVISLEKQLEALQSAKNILEVNLSSLIKTAKTEIARKDRMITELRQELDNSAFRRNKYRIPRITQPHAQRHTSNVENQNYTANETRQPSHRVEPVYKSVHHPVVDNHDNEEKDYKSKPTIQPASTVFGQRLQQRLLEEEEAARVQNEQMKLAISTEKIKHEPNKLIEEKEDINRDNKENQQSLIPLNAKTDENSSRKSSKRPNDDQSDMPFEKQRKLRNHEDSEIDRSIKRRADTKYTSESENYRRLNYNSEYLCSAKPDLDAIEKVKSSSTRLIRRNYDEDYASSNSDDKRDNYRHRTRHSSNHRKRRDNSPDRRKYPSTRSKTLEERDKSKRSEYSRQASDREIKENYERHPRTRGLNESDLRRGVPDLRERIKHHRSDRNDSKMDRGYKNHDNKISDHRRRGVDDSDRNGRRSRSREKTFNNKIVEPVKTRETSQEGSKTSGRSRSRSSGRSSIKDNDRNDRRLKSRRETSDNRTNELVKAVETKKRELVKEENDDKNINTNSSTSLEDGEIADNSTFSPHRSIVNVLTSTSINFENLTTVKLIEDHLLDTFNVETTEVGTAGCNPLKSNLTPLREEKIENIEAYIRNYECEEQMNKLLREKDNEDSGRKSTSLSNTTIDIAETLEQDIDDVVTVDECLKENKHIIMKNSAVHVEGDAKNLNTIERLKENETKPVENVGQTANHDTDINTSVCRRKDESRPIKIVDEAPERGINVNTIECLKGDESRPMKHIKEMKQEHADRGIAASHKENETKPIKTARESKGQDADVNTTECLKEHEAKQIKNVEEGAKNHVEDLKDIDHNEEELNEVSKKDLTSQLNIIKAETIAINNVKTPYAAVLSKYSRRKKISCTINPVASSAAIDSDLSTKIQLKDSNKDVPQDHAKSVSPRHPEISSTTPETCSSIAASHAESEAIPSRESQSTDSIASQPDDRLEFVDSGKVNVETLDSTPDTGEVKSDVNLSEPSLKEESRDTDETAEESDKVAAVNTTETQQLRTNENDFDNRLPETSTSQRNTKKISKKNENNDEIVGEEVENTSEMPRILKFSRKARKVTLLKSASNEAPSVKAQKGKKNLKKSQQLSIEKNNVIKVVKREKSKQLTDSSSSVTLIISGRNVDSNHNCDSTVKRLTALQKQ